MGIQHNLAIEPLYPNSAVIACWFLAVKKVNILVNILLLKILSFINPAVYLLNNHFYGYEYM